MDLPRHIPFPDVSFTYSTDRIALEDYIYSVYDFYQRIRRLGTATPTELDDFLVKMYETGKYFSKCYTRIHSKSTERASKLREAMQLVAKYCCNIAELAITKMIVIDKTNPKNIAIQLAYNLLTNPNYRMSPELQVIHYKLSLRIVKLLAYWYFPQGDAESGDEDESSKLKAETHMQDS